LNLFDLNLNHIYLIFFFILLVLFFLKNITCTCILSFLLTFQFKQENDFRNSKFGWKISKYLFHRIVFSFAVNLEFLFIWFFFCGGRGLNPKPCIYYALSLSIELNSWGHLIYFYFFYQNPYSFWRSCLFSLLDIVVSR